jgi:hypothetical protein
MPIDLFNLNPSNCTPFYKQLCEPNQITEVRRQHINAIWQWYSAMRLADKNFVPDFPKNTKQRWWELETAWFLHNCGYNLSKGKAGSDFFCTGENIAFEVEAVAPTPGKEGHPNFVPEISHTDNLRERERIELLRLTSVIYEKARKRLRDIKKGYSNPSLPFVIAISPADLPYMFSGGDMPAALKAVYPIGRQYYSIDPATGQFLSRKWECRPQLHKSTLPQEPISTQVFCPECGTEPYRKVSALLYSTLNIWVHGYPYPPFEHQKQFVIIHNGDCITPLPRGSIRAGTEYWPEPTGKINEYNLEKIVIEESEPLDTQEQ